MSVTRQRILQARVQDATAAQQLRDGLKDYEQNFAKVFVFNILQHSQFGIPTSEAKRDPMYKLSVESDPELLAEVDRPSEAGAGKAEDAVSPESKEVESKEDTIALSPESMKVYEPQFNYLKKQFTIGSDAMKFAEFFLTALRQEYNSVKQEAQPIDQGKTLCTVEHLSMWIRNISYYVAKFVRVGSEITIENVPEMQQPYVEIDGMNYGVDAKAEQFGGELRIVIKLHRIEGGGFGVVMYDYSKTIDDDQEKRYMYVESLYHSVEIETNIGKRISAKQLFEFIKGMGYEAVGLEDASRAYVTSKVPSMNHQFLPKHAPAIGVYETYNLDGPLQFDQTHPLWVPLPTLNLLKSIVQQQGRTISLYREAAKKAQEAPAAADDTKFATPQKARGTPITAAFLDEINSNTDSPFKITHKYTGDGAVKSLTFDTEAQGTGGGVQLKF